jgi:hypothetical protein
MNMHEPAATSQIQLYLRVPAASALLSNSQVSTVSTLMLIRGQSNGLPERHLSFHTRNRRQAGVPHIRPVSCALDKWERIRFKLV